MTHRAPWLALVLGLVSAPSAPAGDSTVGTLVNSLDAYLGYTLFSPMLYNETYLITNDGRVVKTWRSDHVVGNSAYLLENGDLLRTADPGSPYFVVGGDAGLVERYDWDGNLVWSFLYSDEQVRAHHDVAPLPNGNVLILAFELITGEEAIAAGRDPARLVDGEIWAEHVVEVEPVGTNGGNIVWEWHVWDHLIQDFDPTRDDYGVVAEHPERFDVNFGGTSADWMHANAIDYHPGLDQIMISSPFWSEFWIIDHGTTTEEAAGHTGGPRGRGGDVLYRWGNPQAYRAGTKADRKLYGQHHPHWIPDDLPGAGHVLVFNNGQGRPEGAYSSVEEIVTPVDADGDYPVPPAGTAHGPADASWIYATGTSDFYSPFISGAQRLVNGSTLICQGPQGTFFEIDEGKSEVWRYVSPVNGDGAICQGETPSQNLVFRAQRFAPDFAGFAGRTLIAGDRIEDCILAAGGAAADVRPIVYAAPNPLITRAEIRYTLDVAATVTLRVVDVAGRVVHELAAGPRPAGAHAEVWDAADVAPGVYFYELRAGSARHVDRLTVLE